jgi:hypothetical protein
MVKARQVTRPSVWTCLTDKKIFKNSRQLLFSTTMGHNRAFKLHKPQRPLLGTACTALYGKQFPSGLFAEDNISGVGGWAD